jgi:hypothetical protein
LSNAEKFDKVVGNLLTSLPMLIMSFKDIKEGIGGFKTVITALGNTEVIKNLLITLGNHFEIFTGASIAAQAGAVGFGASLSAILPIVGAVVLAIGVLVVAIKNIYD